MSARKPIRSPLLARVRRSGIGDDQVMPGPYGPRRETYADDTAVLAAHDPAAADRLARSIAAEPTRL